MAGPTENIAEFTVSELSLAVRRTVEDAFGYVRVRGEITGYRGPHSSGHAYFALKDDKARLEAVVWRGSFGKLRFKPEEGLEVIATGKLTTFPGSSKYQIVIEALEPAGAGALMALLEERRRKLAAEGLFAEGRKRALPYLPRVIGVVTSPTGAVIRDILHRLADRFPTTVIVWPVRVQGETSAAEIAAAIHGFNALAEGARIPIPDLLIVARGGGSLEDLWSFNEEIVVRAAAESGIPLISAVGHETDFTLIDFAADRRAPTPTAAAEMAVPVRSELIATVDDRAARLFAATSRLVETGKRELRAAARALPKPDDLFAIKRRTFDELSSRLGRSLLANAHVHRVQYERLAGRLSLDGIRRLTARGGDRVSGLAARATQAAERGLERRQAALARAGRLLDGTSLDSLLTQNRGRLDHLALRGMQATERRIERKTAGLDRVSRLLDAYSYEHVLQRGFALIRSEGALIRSAAMVTPGMALDIRFADGEVPAVAADTGDTGGDAETPKPARKGKAKAGPQGSLF